MVREARHCFFMQARIGDGGSSGMSGLRKPLVDEGAFEC